MNLNILGQTFEIAEPFAEGHICTAPQARTLNQTRLENISNQVRAKLVELKGEGDWTPEAVDKAREMIQERDSAYTEFGMGRTGGSVTVRDPVQSEARKIATEILSDKLKKLGTTLSAQRKADKEEVERKIAEFAAHEKVVAQAKKIVEQRKKTGDLFAGLDLGEEKVAAE